MDTSRPCFRRKGRCPSGPQRTTTNLSTPAPRGSCNRKLAVAPTQRPETSSSSSCANSHSSCHAEFRSSCLAELRVVTALTAATEPTAAPFRWARDRCSSRADAAPASYARSSFLQGLANCGSWSRDCSRYCCCRCLARRYRCWREDEAHCASPDSTEHWPARPDCWPFRQPTVNVARCARHFPDSRQALHQARASCSYCPASQEHRSSSPSRIDFRRSGRDAPEASLGSQHCGWSPKREEPRVLLHSCLGRIAGSEIHPPCRISCPLPELRTWERPYPPD